MKNRTGKLIFIALAFVILLFPLWGWVLPQMKSEELNENRALTEWPTEGSLRQRISQAEDYLDDHLAFREQVITAVLHADMALGESPSDSVIIGTDGWLFYDDGESSADIRRIAPLTEGELERACTAQQTVTDTMAAAGVDYRVLIAPDKHTVYPQYLPISCRTGEGPSHLDELYAALKERTNVRFVDVREALIEAGKETDQYYRYDTHWSSVGAYTAYLKLMEELLPDHPTLHVLGSDEVHLGNDTFNGDLAGMVGMAGILVDHFHGVHVTDTLSREAPEKSFGEVTAYVNDTIPDAPTMLIIHDSFGGAIINFLRESVSELYTFDGEELTYAAIGDLSRYDIVLLERVERNALWLASGIGEGEAWEDEEWDDLAWDDYEWTDEAWVDDEEEIDDDAE